MPSAIASPAIGATPRAAPDGNSCSWPATTMHASALPIIRSALRGWGYGVPCHHSAERAQMLERWIHHYTWHRPHQGIGDLAPTSRLAQSRNNLLTLHA